MTGDQEFIRNVIGEVVEAGPHRDPFEVVTHDPRSMLEAVTERTGIEFGSSRRVVGETVGLVLADEALRQLKGQSPEQNL
jgi:hypothetical protein